MKTLLPFLALVVGIISPSLVLADREPDTDTVRRWVEAGKVLPLDDLLARHQDRIPGRMLDMEVEQEHGRIVYELEFIDERGQVYKVYVDAQTGEWLGKEPDD